MMVSYICTDCVIGPSHRLFKLYSEYVAHRQERHGDTGVKIEETKITAPGFNDPVSAGVSLGDLLQGQKDILDAIARAEGKIMGVLFEVIGGGTRPVTSFEDNFDRANTTVGLGPEWTSHPQGNGFVIEATGAPVFISANACHFQSSAVIAGVFVPITFSPIPIMATVRGSQFSQATYVQGNNVAGTRLLLGGVSVLCGYKTSAWSGYCLEWDSQALGYHIYRLIDLTKTSLFNSGAGAIAHGTVVRLEAEVQSGGVVLTSFLNGAQHAQVTDTNAVRSTEGVPGLTRTLWVGVGAPGTGDLEFNNFSCGKL